jgi:hypothetical protein
MSDRATIVSFLSSTQPTRLTLPAKEVSPGVYTATFNVGSGDAIQEGVVIGRLQRRNQVIYAAAPLIFDHPQVTIIILKT